MSAASRPAAGAAPRHWLRRTMGALWRLYPLLLVVLLWQLVVMAGWTRPMFLPSPAAVATQFIAQLAGGDVAGPVLVSLYRAFAGLFVAVIVGVLAGLAMARSRWARWFMDPLVALAFPAPKIAFMPIFILWFGIDSPSKILLVAFTCVFPIVVATYEGAISVPQVLVWSARSMGTGAARVALRVVLPAAVPFIFSGVRVALPVALITAYTAEMVAGGGGLGATLMYAQRFFETPTVFVCIVLMLLSGVILDRAMLALRDRFIPWQAEET
jgi:ABC-type nitrate/sulfonate/bicarbonate transport system permease component